MLTKVALASALVPCVAGFSAAPRRPAASVVLRSDATESSENIAVSKFKPRAKEAWATDAGYGRYAGLEESEVYHLLKENPAVQALDFLAPFVEKTKTRPALLDGTHAGDCGFDPLNYASTEELLYFYMESEVKHGRLAMIACAGWVGAELANAGERAPNVLNGHLFEPVNFLGTFAAFAAWSYLEHQVYPAQYIEHTPNNGKNNYLHYMDGPYAAGNYEFDPLNLYASLGDTAVARKAMRELEIQHGRAAMLGLTSWVLFEFLTGVPITSAAAVFFKPFWAWGLPFLGENAFLGTVEFAAVLGAGGFLAYKNVMEIDSMKYQGDGDPDFTMFPDEKP